MELKDWKICPLKNGEIALIGVVYGDTKKRFINGQKVQILDVKSLNLRKRKAKTIYGDFKLVDKESRNEREK